MVGALVIGVTTWLGSTTGRADVSGASAEATPSGTALNDRLALPPGEGITPHTPGEQRFAPVGSPEPRVAARLGQGPSTSLLARHGDIRLHLPTRDPVMVGYHEAATARAVPLEPYGQLLTNRNSTRHVSAGSTRAGSSYVILHSRGRAASPTSAVDIVMRDDDPVHAPVTGRIESLRSFLLDGRYPDLRIEIRPDDDPDLRVIVIHVDGVEVAAGDRVVVGETVLARTARGFPFFSQIDELTDPERLPHVHVEVQHPSPDPVADTDLSEE